MTMKALVFSGKGQSILRVRPKPEVFKPTDAIVRMVKTTICSDPCLPAVFLSRTSNELVGTDMHILKGDVASCDTGRILGHEGVAVVESAGEGVMKFKPGDNVIVSCITSCSTCDYCRKGVPSHCVDGGWKLGNTIDGTQAEYVRLPHADGILHLMVEGATAEEQIMISDACRPVSSVVFSMARYASFLAIPWLSLIRVIKVSPGCTIAIVGCGPVGISAMVTAQLYSPARVIMIGRNANRVALAKTMGATHGIISGQGVDVVAVVKEFTNGEGADTVIEAVDVPATFEFCQELVAPGGTIANLGVHGCKVDLHLENLWDKNINTTTAPMLIQLLGSGKIKIAGLVTHRYNFADIEQAYETFGAAAKHKAVKVILHF
ncbi:chaperonin 10-like protein [Armillaria novae-zelandiae]|uniref:Chaperonin 10-like protein n=1 Tax=Armillaria novae-zelandiae TaxID=153914 RepID=A0AA39UD58_9AGAR|nr:chaperonin 10-like protein [Armillaria novae-zelandiae]